MDKSSRSEITTPAASAHPHEESLYDFGNGRLDEASAAKIESHLEECASCCRKLAEAEVKDQFIGALVSAVQPFESALLGSSSTTGDLGRDTNRLPNEPNETPKVIGRFQIRGEISRGGFGIVLRGYDENLRREAAIKIPRLGSFLSSEMRDRFLREAQAAAALNHANIIPIYEASYDANTCYIASAYCRGPNLSDWLKEQKLPMPVRTAAWLIAELADAVDHAHGRGILHRDLKPGNVLLEPVERPNISPERTSSGIGVVSSPVSDDVAKFPYIPKISDFGLAKIQGEQVDTTRSNVIMGTAAYMSPEQASGKAKEIAPQADIYSLGTMLYELLTGRPPLVGETELEMIQRVQFEDPVPPARLRPKLPRDLETICLTCLAKEPARRYASGRGLADDLRRFLRNEPIQARRAGAIENAWRWCRRKPVLAVLSASVALLLTSLFVGAIISALWLNQEQQSTAHQLELTTKAEMAARVAKEATERQLFYSYLAEARAMRRSGSVGRRFVSLETITKAAGLARSLKLDDDGFLQLRNEATAALALVDLRVDKEWPGHRPRSAHDRVGFDRTLEHYARLEPDGRVVVRRMSDNSEVVGVSGIGQLDNNRPYIRFSPDGRLLAVKGGPRVHNKTEVVVWDISQHLAKTTAARAEYVWFDDRIPTGGREKSLEKGTDRLGEWHFVEEPVYCGTKATVWTASGVGQHFFDGARSRLRIGEGDMLFAYVYLDPENPPKQIMLQFNADSWAHRAYWGDDLIEWGEPNSPSRRRIGPLPELGKWVRLDVPAAAVGLRPGMSLDGWAFTQFDGTVYWDKAGSVTQTPQVEATMYALAGSEWFDTALDFSPDSKVLAIVGRDGAICLYDACTGAEKKRFSASDTHASCIRFDPRGHGIAICRGSTVEILDAENGDLVNTLPHKRELYSVAWNADGDYLATGGAEVTVWDLQRGEPTCVCRGHESAVKHVAFDHTGHHLVSWSWDRTTRIWNPRSGRLLLTTEGQGVQFSADDRHLAFTRAGKAIGRWEVGKSNALRLIPQNDRPFSVFRLGFSPDGNLLVTGTDDIVSFWQLKTETEIARLKTMRHAMFDVDGSRLFTAGSSGFLVWNVQREENERKPVRSQDVSSAKSTTVLRVETPQVIAAPGPGWPGVTFHDQAAASRDWHTFGVATTYGKLVLVDPNTHDIKRRIDAPGCLCLSVSPDGKWVAAAPYNSRAPVCVWNVKTGKVETRLPVINSPSARITFSPDGRWLVTADEVDYTFWTVGTWQKRHVLSGAAHAISFTRDGKKVATRASVHSVKLYWTETMQEFATLETPYEQTISALCFAPDETYLAAGTGTGEVHVWDLRYVRGELAKMKLDWTEPPFPPQQIAPLSSTFEIEFDFGDNWMAWSANGRTLAKEEKWQEAIVSYSRAIELGTAETANDSTDSVRTEWAQLHDALAWTLATCPDPALKNPSRAVELAETAVALASENGNCWNTLGVAHCRSGDWQAAIPALEKSVDLQPGRASSNRFFLAIAHWHIGDKHAAREFFVDAVEAMDRNRPDDPQLKNLRNEVEWLMVGKQRANRR